MIIGSATVTFAWLKEVTATTRYYKLQASTLNTPSKPTVNPPSGWTTTEPTYTEGATNSLYFCDLTEFSNNAWGYSDVSLSSSYEAAKAAYNKAQAAKDDASDAKADAQAASTTASEAKDEAASAKALSESTANHFFTDTEGAHVASVEGDATAGSNLLLESDGIEIRDGTEAFSWFKRMAANIGSWNEDTQAGDTAEITLMDGSAVFRIEIRGTRDFLKIASGDMELGASNIKLAGASVEIATQNTLGHVRTGVIADFIVEEGTKNGVNYEVYASGRMHCWFEATSPAGTFIPWGSMYYSPYTVAATWPYEFASKPVENSDVQISPARGGWKVVGSGASTTQSGTYYMVRHVAISGTITTIAYINAWGWKK